MNTVPSRENGFSRKWVFSRKWDNFSNFLHKLKVREMGLSENGSFGQGADIFLSLPVWDFLKFSTASIKFKIAFSEISKIVFQGFHHDHLLLFTACRFYEWLSNGSNEWVFKWIQHFISVGAAIEPRETVQITKYFWKYEFCRVKIAAPTLIEIRISVGAAIEPRETVEITKYFENMSFAGWRSPPPHL